MNPKLLLDLPAIPGPIHHGGEIIIGPDNALYVTLGDIEGFSKDYSSTKAQNYIERDQNLMAEVGYSVLLRTVS